MIEVLKQALEALKDVGVLTDREWQAVHKNKANELRQAIAELESQEPVATVASETGADITMSWWHEPALPMGTKLFTHPPQRKPLTDFMVEMSKVLDNYNEQNIFIDGWLSAEAAHVIKE